MTLKVTTFLMFDGTAEAAMTLYATVFDEYRLQSIERCDSDEPAMEGKVKRAVFALAGQEFTAIDSPATHEFTFTPAIPLFVDFSVESDWEEAFQQLADTGEVLMPPDNYGFSPRFAWINDGFGVSWQLNLTAD